MKHICLAVVFLIASNRAGAANFMNGNRLLDLCRGTLVLECLGYVQGVVDDLEDARVAFQRAPCLHEGVTVGQVKDATLNYLVAHPEHRDWSAAALVGLAVEGAWDCK